MLEAEGIDINILEFEEGGRYAGRISNSKFYIGKKKFLLSKNEGKNSLHGGRKGFAVVPWKKIKQTKDKIVYQIKSKVIKMTEMSVSGIANVFV